MTTTEIIKRLSRQLGISEQAAREQLRAKLSHMAQHLEQQGSVNLPGMGTLAVRMVKSHRGYNLATGQYEMRPARKQVSFKTESAYRHHLKQKPPEESS